MYRPTPQTNAEGSGITNAPTANLTTPAPSQSQANSATLKILAPAFHCPQVLADGLLRRAREMQTTATTAAPLPASVQIDSYTTDAEALAKLNSGTGYAWAALSDRLLEDKIKASALTELDAGTITGVDPIYLHHSFDLRNKFSLPYACTYYAFAIHKDAFPNVKDMPKKWADLFTDAQFSQCAFPEDSFLLYTLNLLAAGQIGKTQKQIALRARAIPAGNQQEDQPIRVGTIEQLFNLAQSNLSWKLILPEEGMPIRLYHWTLPRNGATAADQVLTNAFFKMWSTPEGAEHLVTKAHVTPTMRKARKILPPQLVTNSPLFPSEALMDKAIFVQKPSNS